MAVDNTVKKYINTIIKARRGGKMVFKKSISIVETLLQLKLPTILEQPLVKPNII